MKVSLRDLGAIAHTEFRNKNRLAGARLRGVSTDSRTLAPGEVFFAIKGENFDGHAFVADAFDRGAAAAVVERQFNVQSFPTRSLLVVENAVRALGQLAHLHRSKHDIPIIAVAGSNGKTTTKEMVVAVLSTKYNVLSTEGNLNNHIGVPRTLFRLSRRHDVAVVEMGTNHPGEIQYLCDVAAPTYGLITNIGREHLEFFGSVAGVAAEEGVLFDYLRNDTHSVAFVNSDDPHIRRKAKGLHRRVVFGTRGRGVDVRGTMVGKNDAGCFRFAYSRGNAAPKDSVQLAVPGQHNLMNALAAVTVGVAFHVPAKSIRKALENFRPPSKRMQVLNYEGVIIYNDTYNANPDSVASALETLAASRAPGKKIAVLADMRELGALAEGEHRQVGREASRLGIDCVLTYGELARYIHDAVEGPFALHYDEKNVLAEYLAELIAPGDAVLVKGSRSMKMEDVVTFLEERLCSAVVPLV